MAKYFSPRGGAALVHQRHLPLGERLRQLPRVPDGGRCADELRPRAVELAEPAESPEDVGHVGAVDPPQAVQLVDDHVAQVLEQLHPLGVVREDALVKHVGVRDHDVGTGPDRLAGVLGGVAVVREGADVGPEGLDGAVQGSELILGEGLGRKEVESPCVRVLQDPVEDGQVVAERLPGGGGGDDDDVPPLLDPLIGLPLVRVEPGEPLCRQDLTQPGVQIVRKGHDLCGPRRKVPESSENGFGSERLLDLEGLQDGEQVPVGVLAMQHELLTHGRPPGPHRLGGSMVTPA